MLPATVHASGLQHVFQRQQQTLPDLINIVSHQENNSLAVFPQR